MDDVAAFYIKQSDQHYIGCEIAVKLVFIKALRKSPS